MAAAEDALKPFIHPLRILFRTEDADRAVCWFHPQADDLYWGEPTPGPQIPPIDFSGTSLRIEIPEDFENLTRGQKKASYHSSGQFHIKEDGVITSRMPWPKPLEIR